MPIEQDKRHACNAWAVVPFDDRWCLFEVVIPVLSLAFGGPKAISKNALLFNDVVQSSALKHCDPVHAPIVANACDFAQEPVFARPGDAVNRRFPAGSSVIFLRCGQTGGILWTD